MRHYLTTLLIGAYICQCGCKPTPAAPPKTDMPEKVEEEYIAPLSEKVKEEHIAPLSEKVEEEYTFTLLSGPWAKYLSAPPKILVLDRSTHGILKLLSEEQTLIQAVLDADSTITQTSDHSALTNRLAELKASLPSAENVTDYVRSNNKSYRYYDWDRRQKSSSPILVRDVSYIVANASLEDIDATITSLQNVISKWTQKTELMRDSGTSAIMRRANIAYLKGLRKYTEDFIEIRTELHKIEQAQAQKSQNKASILQNWQNFETTRLSILKDYFKNNDLESIDPINGNTYTLNDSQLANPLILCCETGPRTVYFELAEDHHPNHPFILVNVTVPND